VQELDDIEVVDHRVGELDEGRHDPLLSRHALTTIQPLSRPHGLSRQILKTQTAIDNVAGKQPQPTPLREGTRAQPDKRLIQRDPELHGDHPLNQPAVAVPGAVRGAGIGDLKPVVAAARVSGQGLAEVGEVSGEEGRLVAIWLLPSTARRSRAESAPPPIGGRFPVRPPRSSDRFDSLRGMADDEATLVTVADRDGREVVLFARIWEQKITLDHPELAGHREAVMETVAHPDHVEADGLPARPRFYRRDVGPSRWLLAVVSYEQQPGRIITALANRKDPKQWTP
jgi:hypothetical protein